MLNILNLFSGKKDFVILNAVHDDLAHVAKLHGVSFPRGWTKVEITALVEQPECTCLVARPVGEPNSPVGGFNLIRQTRDEAEIISIAVDPKQRRQGLADSLMREAILRLQTDRVGALILEVDENNAAAIRLYEKLGFVEVGARPGYYKKDGDTKMEKPATALVMRLDLFKPHG